MDGWERKHSKLKVTREVLRVVDSWRGEEALACRSARAVDGCIEETAVEVERADRRAHACQQMD